MRLRFAAAAVIAASLAAPAAAQQDAEPIVRGMIERLAANHGDVQDYTLEVEYGGMSSPIYIYREATRWDAATQDEVMGSLLAAALLWPQMAPATPDQVEERVASGGELLGDPVYAGTDTVRGHRVHVLRGGYTGYDEMLDSVSLFVDAGTWQVLRMAARGEPREHPVFGEGVGMALFLDLDEYRDWGGITLPSRMRLRVRLTFEAASKDLREARHQVRRLLEAEGPEAVTGSRRVALELLARMIGGEDVELPIVVRGVTVNSGPPAWLDEGDEM